MCLIATSDVKQKCSPIPRCNAKPFHGHLAKFKQKEAALDFHAYIHAGLSVLLQPSLPGYPKLFVYVSFYFLSTQICKDQLLRPPPTPWDCKTRNNVAEMAVRCSMWMVPEDPTVVSAILSAVKRIMWPYHIEDQGYLREREHHEDERWPLAFKCWFGVFVLIIKNLKLFMLKFPFLR